MPMQRTQRTRSWLVESRESSRQPRVTQRAAGRQVSSRQAEVPWQWPAAQLHDRRRNTRKRDREDIGAHISQLSLEGVAWGHHQRASHICRARRKPGPSDDEDLDPDDEDDEDVGGRSSRNSNSVDDDMDSDDDDDEEVEADAGVASIHDPTTRLFQMVKDRDYDDEEEETVDDDDEDEGLQTVDNAPEMQRRGRKRKTTYDQANEDEELGMEDEELDGNVSARTDTEDLDADEDGDVDLDAIMGTAFDGTEEADAAQMPNRAQQARPADSADGAFLDELEEDQALMADDQLEPLMEYSQPPERRLLLGDLLAACGLKAPTEASELIEISSIDTDWRKVSAGSLYVPLPQPDSHQYYAVGTGTYIGEAEMNAQAIDQGAVAVLSQEPIRQEDDSPAEVPIVLVPDLQQAASQIATAFYDQPSSKMNVIGVTGSRGKTTTSWLVRGIFEEMQLVTGMIGSLEYSIAVDKMTDDGSLWKPDEEDPTLKRDCSTAFHLTPYLGKYEVPPSTPDVVKVQKVMAGMADRGATACVYEADLQAVANGWADGVNMDIAIYMGFTKEDVEAAESIEHLLEGQKRFFSSLKDSQTQTAVINLDDDYCEQIMEYASEVPVVTFSVDDDTADVYVNKATFGIWETEVVIQTPPGKLTISSALIGRHNLPNILAAVACGLALTIDEEGIPLKAIVNGISATEIVPGRTEVIDEEQEFSVVIDAANTPESLSRLLDSVREANARRIFLVFGCQGGQDKEIRPFMGEIAHYKADTVIITNDNPRGESPNVIVADIVAGYPDEILSLNAMQAYPPGFLQDPGRIQFEALEFAWHNSYEYRRYVMEDRWTAIRWAIGTAQKKDVVILAGKGAQDYQEYYFDGLLIKSWFDDRVECRNALSKVKALNKFDADLDRKELPWMEVDERPDNLRVYNLAAD